MPATTTTTLRNVTGQTRTFSFIPPFGRRLANNEEVEIEGDIYVELGKSRRRLQAFQRSVARGDLIIVSSPGNPEEGGPDYGPHVQTLQNLRDVVEIDRFDKQLRLVEDAGLIYRFDTTGVGADNGTSIIAPTVGTGRWFFTSPAETFTSSVHVTTDHAGIPGVPIFVSTVGSPATIGPVASGGGTADSNVVVQSGGDAVSLTVMRLIITPDAAISSYDVDIFRDDTFGGTSFYQALGITLGLTPFEDFSFVMPDDDGTAELHVRITNNDGSLSSNFDVEVEAVLASA